MKRAFSATILAAVWLCAGSASAQNAWDPPAYNGFQHWDTWPEPPRSGASVELGFWNSSFAWDEGASSVSGLLRAGVVIERVFEIGAVAGWGWGEVTPFIGEAASAANPLISGTFIAGEQRWRLRAGAGVTIPAAPNDAIARVPAFYGAATRGLSELWLWAPARISIVPAFSFEATPVDYFYVDAAIRPAILIPYADTYPAVPGDPHRGVDFVLDTQATIGFRPDVLLIAVRFRTVFMPMLRDQAQMSLEPFMRLSGIVDGNSTLVFGEVRLLMNLDDELGFAFDPLNCPAGDDGKCRGVWGLFVAFGGGA